MTVRPFDPNDVTITKVAELFLAELKRGKTPDVERYAKAFPHLANDIREEFPTLMMLERAVGGGTQNRAIPAPSALGGCELEKVVGNGAMGTVYRAYQRELDRTVAVKLIPVRGVDSERLIERFELERRAMARLDHPNIVPVFSYGHEGPFAYLVMRYIEGRSLDLLLDGNGDYRLRVFFKALNEDWAELARLGASVASGLQHAHDQGLIHRDIKPANLILDASGKIWITDFGLAKVYDYARSLSRTGEAIGTPRYMAPEQLRGVCDPRSDVYSLGITLYEIAANERAWNENSVLTLTSNRESLKLPDIREKNPSVPEHLARIIMKACQFDPDERYPSARELEVVLRRFMEGITPSDRRRRRREPDAVYQRRVRRRRMFTLATMPPIVLGAAWALHHFEGRAAVPSPMNPSAPITHAVVAKEDLVTSPLQAITPPSPPPTLSPAMRRPTSNFIEQMADADEQDLTNVVTQFIRDSVEASSDEFHLADDEKEQIVAQVDEVFHRLREKYQTDTPKQTFIQGYRDTTLPVGTRILSVIRLVDRSSLSEPEKVDARVVLRHFARAVVNRSIPSDQALNFVATLTAGRIYSSDELDQLTVAESDLRGWLKSLKSRMIRYPQDASGPLKVGEEMESAIERMMHSP